MVPESVESCAESVGQHVPLESELLMHGLHPANEHDWWDHHLITGPGAVRVRTSGIKTTYELNAVNMQQGQLSVSLHVRH